MIALFLSKPCQHPSKIYPQLWSWDVLGLKISGSHISVGNRGSKSLSGKVPNISLHCERKTLKTISVNCVMERSNDEILDIF